MVMAKLIEAQPLDLAAVGEGQGNELAIREKLLRLEAELLALPQLEIPVRHYFSPGIYAREVTIPAGSVVTGKIHKYAHLNVVSKGDISVLTEDGVKRIAAPFTFVSPPGTKRAGWTHAETVWTTIHATDETDLEKIEAYFIAKDFPEYLAFRASLALEDGGCAAWPGTELAPLAP